MCLTVSLSTSSQRPPSLIERSPCEALRHAHELTRYVCVLSNCVPITGRRKSCCPTWLLMKPLTFYPDYNKFRLLSNGETNYI